MGAFASHPIAHAVLAAYIFAPVPLLLVGLVVYRLTTKQNGVTHMETSISKSSKHPETSIPKSHKHPVRNPQIIKDICNKKTTMGAFLR
ncbi:hypothetical protein K490DRAFT_66177 [Saccharata proteae CBS 121410]|uniref:Uncharacterized protein n=1 Tax=Saccharata proteae CBS 121410 TaxID=1314787 RepID=A0A9P4LWS7_9PEZI|nr:hypothetical protein K490DRAFT_66177 [Saccharata proteae CBS 121410]